MPSVTQAPPHGVDSRCVTSDGSHSFRVHGYATRSAATRLDCNQPLRAVCQDCGHTTYWRCDCSAATKCVDCAERRRKLVARIVDLGTTQRLGSGFTYFLTLSAPGERAHRRWRQGRGGNDRPHCDCHTVWETQQRGDWNSAESSHWNRLRTALSRLTEGSLTYIGSVEVQERGMLHRHVVLNVDRPLLPAEVGQLALTAGYGCVHDLQVIQSASKAAWYISKYVTKSSGDRQNVPWRRPVLDEATGELEVLDTIPTFRTWSAARTWGFTLKGLREIARMQARARAEALRALGAGLDTHTAGNSTQTPSLTSSDPP